jgi:site-specific recombinase XerD
MKRANSIATIVPGSFGAVQPVAVSPSFRLRWFADGELRCKGPSCGKPLPAGFYGKNKRTFYCGNNCVYRFSLSQRKPVKCTFCKRLFVKTGTAHTKPFCSPAHFHQWRNLQTDQKKAGRFTKLLHEYVDEIGPRQYAPGTLRGIRCTLVAFFDFMNRSNIRTLNSVGPKVISRFLNEVSKRRPKSFGKLSGHLRFFFDWLIVEERRSKPNPVIARIHCGRVSLRLPRPFNTAELSIIWLILNAQSNVALRLAVAISQEAALRISEVANLRIEDVDLASQQAFVRLPNKTKREHYVPFHNRTKHLLEEWLAVRGERDFDYLLVGVSGKPMSSATLRNHLNRLMKDAVPGWCFHRLRHVAASTLHRGGADGTTVKKTFGWRSSAVMEGYTEVLSQEIREGYDRAFKVQDEHLEGSTTTRSMGEFFANIGDSAETAVKTGL